MQYKWTKQLALAWLCMLVLIPYKSQANHAFRERSENAIRAQSKHPQSSIKLDELLSLVSKREKVYFVYADNVLKNQKIEGVDIAKMRLDKLNIVLDRVGLRAVKISASQYVIESKSGTKLTDAPLKTASALKAQQGQQVVQGVVQDSNGGALVGVTVKSVEGHRATRSDAKGAFSIDAVAGEKLTASFLGYETHTVEVPQSGQLLITMQEIVSSLEEVVVVGYGTQKKSDLTGAVGMVDVGKSLKSRPVTNVQELLAGTIPGLNVSKGTGAVGSGASINIRGTSTIGGSSGALVLIDGVPGNINTLNPNDIESISTLKDAASASIYGSRAANGVLLITTKSGQALDKLTVELNSSVGVQSPQFLVDFVGSEDFMRLWDQALVNDGKSALYGTQGVSDLRNGRYADVKWYEEIYKRNTLINNNYLALSGNSEKVKYRFSASHDYQDGTLPNNDYNRIIFKPDMTFKISNKIIARANIQYTETYINTPRDSTFLLQSQATRIAPIHPIKNSAGQYGVGSSIAGNPIAAAYEGGSHKRKYKELMGIFEISYKPIDDLEIKGNFSRYTQDMWGKNRGLSYELYNEDGTLASVQNRITNLRETASSNYRNMVQFTADYTKSLAGHNFKVLGGFSQEYFNTSEFSAFRDNLPFNNVDVLNSGSEINMQARGYGHDVAIQSLFARFNYDYKGKYLFQANVRGDGSSRFAKGHRWGVFPSFSAGWNVHQEDFFHSELFTSLKLRG